MIGTKRRLPHALIHIKQRRAGKESRKAGWSQVIIVMNARLVLAVDFERLIKRAAELIGVDAEQANLNKLELNIFYNDYNLISWQIKNCTNYLQLVLPLPLHVFFFEVGFDGTSASFF
jgi:hypothetical protein